MPDFHDLWVWIGELEESLPFAIALSVLLAKVLASVADWAERHFVSDRVEASQDHVYDRRALEHQRPMSKSAAH